LKALADANELLNENVDEPEAKVMRVVKAALQPFHLRPAPSQKAALEAWGSDSDLFVQKIAEQVTDPDLMNEALAYPGKIIRKLRGTIAEQVEALGVDAAKENAKRLATSQAKPSRAALTRAEREVQEIKQRQDDEIRVLRAEPASLQKKVDLESRLMGKRRGDKT
jgi:hypothetical protein